MSRVAELHHALDALEDAVASIRAEIVRVESGPVPAREVDEIVLYGLQGQVLYRGIRLRPLTFRVDWPGGFAGSPVTALSISSMEAER